MQKEADDGGGPSCFEGHKRCQSQRTLNKTTAALTISHTYHLILVLVVADEAPALHGVCNPRGSFEQHVA